MMMNILFLIIAVLLIYLVYDLYVGYRTDRTLDRLNYGFNEVDDDLGSMWDGAADLLQLASIRRLLTTSAFSRKLDLNIRRSPLRVGIIQVVSMMLLVALALAVMGYLFTQNIIYMIAPLIAVPALTWVFFDVLAKRQQKRIDNQLSGMVTSLLTTMKSGGTPIQALQATVKNAANPMRDSIATVMSNLQLGKTPNTVWKEWADSWGTKNTKLLATGIRLKWEAGGEMTSILEHILESIEFNKRIELKVSTLTAQSKASAFVLGALPFGLFALQYFQRPDLIQGMINSSTGQLMIIYSFSSAIIGLIVLLKIAKLKA